MEDDLNKLFAELERQCVEVTIYARLRPNETYEVDVYLGFPNPNGGGTRETLSVGGKGATFIEALSTCYDRVKTMADILQWQPVSS